MSLLTNLFGSRKRSAAHDRTARQSRSTISGTPPDPSAPRVRPLDSGQISGATSAMSPQEDTGPWFIGKTVGEIYQIRGVLGRGGMGIVYRAYDTATQKDVAVKLPLGKFVEDEDARKRFAREAEVWTELVHPHIVRAFEVKDDKTTDYRPAIFMDCCDGGSLAARLERGRLPLAEALDIAIQVCWAMEFAHGKGKVHRDLKPGNVLLTADGKALVTDFGLVKFLETGTLGSADSAPLTEMTQLATTLSIVGGTPQYMAPEQWAGRAGPETDLYAFGVMLYEILCNRLPFTANHPAALRRMHDELEPPDPLTINGQLPSPLAALMRAALIKDRKNRAAKMGTFDAVATQLADAYQRITGQDYIHHRARPTQTDLTRAEQHSRASILIRLGAGAWLRGDRQEALRHNTQASDIFRSLGDLPGLQASLGNLGLILLASDPDRALVLLREQQALCEQLRHLDGLQRSYHNQAMILLSRSDFSRALILHEREADICLRLGDFDQLSGALGGQATALMALGNLTRAMQLLIKQERTCRSLGKRDELSVCLGNQGRVLQARGNMRGAMKRYKEEERLCRLLGYKDGLLKSLCDQASIHYQRGDRSRAERCLEEAEAICRDRSDLHALTPHLDEHLQLLKHTGDIDKALALLDMQSRARSRCHPARTRSLPASRSS